MKIREKRPFRSSMINMIQLAKQEQLAKFQPFMNTPLFSVQGETLHIVTIAMFFSTLASLRKFQHFRRPIYNLAELLWWSFYCENSKPLAIFTKKLHRRRLCFFKDFSRVLFIYPVLFLLPFVWFSQKCVLQREGGVLVFCNF